MLSPPQQRQHRSRNIKIRNRRKIRHKSPIHIQREMHECLQIYIYTANLVYSFLTRFPWWIHWVKRLGQFSVSVHSSDLLPWSPYPLDRRRIQNSVVQKNKCSGGRQHVGFCPLRKCKIVGGSVVSVHSSLTQLKDQKRKNFAC